ncbi:MAG: prepilin-type N-terminal cleavage/methylation domain-containing protein [Syntrophobacteraceae bacterium]|nr:prepilin-type N-terminal cleavage/methylation domain-containing protein [Syntrophobacteraceae bacterium]
MKRSKSELRVSDPGSGGFTLIELIVATAISAMVIAIVSVCFSFALRMWQTTANRKPDQTLRLAQLLQRQLAECDPTPINFEHGSSPLFIGKTNSLAFITSHSVKAISKGVPVVVRYTFDPVSRELSYSEMVMDPYRPEKIEQFASSTGQKSEARVYKIDFQKFTLNYAGSGASEFSPSWTSTGDMPLEILFTWQGADKTAHSMVCMVNSPLPVQVNMLNSSIPGGSAPSSPPSGFIPASPPGGFTPPSSPPGGF